MLEQLSTLEKVDTASKLLDQLSESKGREKCAQICVLSDLLDLLRKDILIIEEKVKDQEQADSFRQTKLEIVHDGGAEENSDGKEEA